MFEKKNSAALWVRTALAIVGLCLANFAFATPPQETTLYNFMGQPSDGAIPVAGMVADKAGNLYGTTQFGGTADLGTVFELTPPATQSGSWTETVLYSFQGGEDGSEPVTSLVLDAAGNLYGTAFHSGTGNSGTVYRLSRPAVSGGGWTFTVLYAFSGGADGLGPGGSLIFDRGGNLLGTTAFGGIQTGNCGLGCGTAFQLSPPANHRGAWTESVLYAFTGLASAATQADGALPYGGLVADLAGNVYGTTNAGGSNPSCWGGCGTVFRLHPSGGAWTETVLYRFKGGADGLYPYCTLALSGGKLYGTSLIGGSAGGGTVFQLTPSSGPWLLNPIYEFGVDLSAGVAAGPGVTFDSQGNLYGTTRGSLTVDGTVFELMPPSTSGGAWTEITLYDFNGTGPYGPEGLLLLRGNSLLGVSRAGVGSLGGTVYEVTH